MKITVRQLKQLIKEEVKRSLYKEQASPLAQMGSMIRAGLQGFLDDARTRARGGAVGVNDVPERSPLNWAETLTRWSDQLQTMSDRSGRLPPNWEAVQSALGRFAAHYDASGPGNITAAGSGDLGPGGRHWGLIQNGDQVAMREIPQILALLDTATAAGAGR